MSVLLQADFKIYFVNLEKWHFISGFVHSEEIISSILGAFLMGEWQLPQGASQCCLCIAQSLIHSSRVQFIALVRFELQILSSSLEVV